VDYNLRTLRWSCNQAV